MTALIIVYMLSLAAAGGTMYVNGYENGKNAECATHQTQEVKK